jgi:predicted AlkP superfamily pyrophosphatase or phosphodiesterase
MMRHRYRRSLLLLSLFTLVLASVVARTQAQKPLVLLISIDGLRPDNVLRADELGLKVPNLRRFLADGAYATGVTGVLPTVTYPSHTTLLTGVAPAVHGIVANTTFDPLNKNYGGWYWYAEDIKVPTLWDYATKNGISTANVYWPVSVGAAVAYNISQVWRAGTEDDRKLQRSLSTPGLLEGLEKQIGTPFPVGSDESIEADELRARFAELLLRQKNPGFMTVYLTALDHIEHETAPFSRESFAVLEKLDAVVGRLRQVAGSRGPAVTCVVSDHGFARTDKELNLNSALRQAGLIELNQDGSVKSWRASAWLAGGSAAIMLKDSKDNDARTKVRRILDQMIADPVGGIAKVLDPAEFKPAGGFPGAAFVIGLKPGYQVGPKLEGPVVVPRKLGGMHGYLPENPDMQSSFFLVGPGIRPGFSLGTIDMRDIAPTLADLLGVKLSTAEGHSLLQQMTLVPASLSDSILVGVAQCRMHFALSARWGSTLPACVESGVVQARLLW